MAKSRCGNFYILQNRKYRNNAKIIMVNDHLLIHFEIKLRLREMSTWRYAQAPLNYSDVNVGKTGKGIICSKKFS